MQFLEAAPRRELQKFAKEWGIKANIKSDEIREKLLEKGFTAPGRSSTTPEDNQTSPENQPPSSPRAPSASEVKLKGLQNRMKMRRNALHVQNGTASKYYTPAAGEPDTTSSATVFATPARTLEQSTLSSKPTGSRGIPSSPPPPPPHLVTPGSKQQQGIPSKRADVKASTPSPAQGAGGPSYLPRSPVNSISGESTSPQPPNLTPASTPAQIPHHIADMPAAAAALQRLKSNRTGSRPATAVSVPSHLLANAMESSSQTSADTASVIPGSSSPPQKPGNQGISASKAAGRTPPASPGADGADSQRPTSTNSASKGVKHVPVHLKKKPLPGITGADGASDAKGVEEKPARPAVRDTLGLSKRRKPMHSQPIKAAPYASVPPVPPRPLRPQSGPSGGSQKSKSVGAGTTKVSGDVSPPLRLSRSPAPRRGVGGRQASANRRTSIDRAGKRGVKGGDSTPEKTPPPRRSISVEPRPLPKRTRRAAARGTGAVIRSSSAFGSDTSRDPSSTPERESSMASVGTSATTSNPGSVAAALLGGSLADRLGRGAAVGSRRGGPTAESTVNKSALKGAAASSRGSGLPRRSISPAPAFGSPPAADPQIAAKSASQGAAGTEQAGSQAAALGHQKQGATAPDPSGSSPSLSPQGGGGGMNSRLPRLSPSPSPSPTRHEPQAHLAASEASPSPGGFKFPTAAAREPSAETPTFAEADALDEVAEDNSFAFGDVAAHPADSSGLREWQSHANHPAGNQSGAQHAEASSHAFASHLDDLHPTSQTPPNLHLPDDSPTGASGPSVLAPVGEAAPAPQNSDYPAVRAAPPLRKSRSARNRARADAILPSQLQNRRKAGGTPPPPTGPSLAGVAAAALAHRVSSANGNDALLALYGSTDLSSDAGGLSRVNTGTLDPTVDDGPAPGSAKRAMSPLSPGNASSPAKSKAAAASVDSSRDTQGVVHGATGLHASKHSGGGHGGSAFNLAGPAAAGSVQGTAAAAEPAGAPQGGQSAFEDLSAKVWNTSVSDMDSESYAGFGRTFRSSSTADGGAGSRPMLGTATSAGASSLPTQPNATGQRSRAHSTSEMHNGTAHPNQCLSDAPHIQKHRSSRLEDTTQWLSIRNRELEDLEVTMHELNQTLLAGGASADLPGPSNANFSPSSDPIRPVPTESAVLASPSRTGRGFSRSISMLDPSRGTAPAPDASATASYGAPQRGRPLSGGGGASALMVQKYAEMEAELAQLPPRRRRAASAAPPQSRGAVSMSMDGFLMAERRANGGGSSDTGGAAAAGPNGEQGHGHSVSLPGQAVLDRAAAAAARPQDRRQISVGGSSDGSTMGMGSSSGGGGGAGGSSGTGITLGHRNVSRSPVGRIRKPTVGSTLSPLPEKGKWAEPVRATSLGFQRKPASAIGESLSKSQQQKNVTANSRQGLRAPKASPAARSRSAHPAPLRRATAAEFPAATQSNLTMPRALAEASKLPSAAGVLAEPPRLGTKPTGLTQSFGAGRGGPGRVSTTHPSATTPSKFPARIGGSMGTGPSVPGSPYLASPAAAKSAANRSRSGIGELRPSNVKARAGAAASVRRR